jgi:hypothetical protein
MTLLMKNDPYGARQALGNATVQQDGKAVRLDAPWPYDALESGVKRLAELQR